jgi:hypothetical protein
VVTQRFQSFFLRLSRRHTDYIIGAALVCVGVEANLRNFSLQRSLLTTSTVFNGTEKLYKAEKEEKQIIKS